MIVEEIEAPISSRISSTTSLSRTLGTPKRGMRRQLTNPSFISARLNSFDDSDDILNTGGATTPRGVEWEYSRADINMPPNFTMTDVDLSPRGLETRMRDLLTDSRYWIRMVERLGYDRKVFDAEHVPNLDQLSRYYDSSDLGLLRVFHLFDNDRDRLMTKDEMVRGLVQQGLVTDPTLSTAIAACDELFELCSDNGVEVSPLEFLLALKSMRLAAILHPFSLLTETRRNIVAAREMDIHFHEYREDLLTAAKPLSDPIDFLFRVQELPHDQKIRVQWIHCHEASRRTVLALAVQLGLDPRYVLDVFTLWREQAKADRVRDMHSLIPRLHTDIALDSTEWVFLVVPVIRLTSTSKASLEPHFEWRRQQKLEKDRSSVAPDILIEIETCNMAIFVTGSPGRGTTVTFTSEWCGLCRMDLHSADGDRKDNSAREDSYGEIEGRKAHLNTMTVSDSDLDVFPKVLKLLDTSYSHLRTGDAFTLVLKMISDNCEEYVRIIDAYEAAIDALNYKLKKRRDSLSHSDVRQIQRSARHLAQLHRLVRPVSGIIDILSQQTSWGGESTLYISDLKSNVAKFMNDSIALSESADVLRKRYQEMGKARTGSVLYLLTLVTTVFAPAEFVATLYGMNFKQPKHPTKFAMPELTWKLGYLYYWLVVFVMLSVVFTFYRKKSWI